MSTTDIRAIAYCRQSESRPGESGAAQSLSLRSQEERFRQWCERNDAIPVAVVTDHDVRGTVADRPGLAELRQRIASDRPNTLWVLSLSRLARDVVIHFSLIREIQQLGITRIVSETEGEIADEFFHGILALMHAKNKTEMSMHLRNAFARRARDGGFPTGPTPTGYQRPHTITIHRANGTSYERQTGEPVIEPDGARLIREIFDRFDDGDSLHAIANDLHARGTGPRGGEWSRSSLRSILTSPIYAGDIAHKGVVVAHNDAWAIVPRDQWERVQAKVNRLTIVRRGEISSWPEGLVSHACGNRLYYQDYTGKSKGHGGMFVCRRGSRCEVGRAIIGARLLETAVRACLLADFARIRTPAEAAVWAQERSGGTKALTHRAVIAKRLSDAQARWRRNHERFSEGKLAIPIMDAEDARLADAEREHADAVAALPVPLSAESIARTADVLAASADVIVEMRDSQLRALLTDLGTALVGPDGVRIVYHEPFEPHLPSTLIAVPRGGRGLRT